MPRKKQVSQAETAVQLGTPIALVTSDLHLQDRAWQSHQGLASDAYWAFSWIVQTAIRLGLPLIAAGDLIDKRVNAAQVAGVIRRQMDLLAQAGLEFYFVQGQHDLQPRPWFSEIHHWPTWLDDTDEELAGYTLTGLDWTPAADLQRRLDGLTQPHPAIMVMHQVCQRFMGTICPVELDWQMLPASTQLLIVGDYHKHQEVSTFHPVTAKKLTVLSPGSTSLQEISEEPDKHVFILRDNLTVTSLRIPTRRVLTSPALVLDEQLDAFIGDLETALPQALAAAEADNLPPELHKPILRVQWSEGIPKAYARIRKAVGDRAFLFTKLLPSPEQQGLDLIQREQREAVREGGLLAGLSKLVTEDSDEYRLVRGLLESADPALALREMRAQFLAGEWDAPAPAPKPKRTRKAVAK